MNYTLYKIKPNAPKISFQLDIQDIMNTSFNAKHVIQRHRYWQFDIPKLIEEINWNRDSYFNGFFSMKQITMKLQYTRSIIHLYRDDENHFAEKWEEIFINSCVNSLRQVWLNLVN